LLLAKRLVFFLKKNERKLIALSSTQSRNPTILLAAPKFSFMPNLNGLSIVEAGKGITKLLNDRRKDVRFRVKEGAMIAPASETRRYWKMIDVSRGGASFRYIPFENITNSPSFDIATRNLEFLLENVPFRSISDIELSDVPSSFKLRRHSVEFINLTDLQKELLEQFIKEHTLGSIS
jgi:hypothetical protein